ncbi:MAG: C10 family peptidase [Bacteroidota bacterium]|nr:C10 family peptidase [Bacteroidota bacterium]
MKTIKIFTALLLLCFFGNLNAQSLSSEMAENLATKFMAKKFGTKNSPNQMVINQKNGELVYYTFLYDNAFVIVSGEANYEPILAYSGESTLSVNPEDLPPAMKQWMDNLAQDILRVRSQNIEASSSAVENRQRILSNQPLVQTRAVTPLLSTTWNQGCGYNDDCPADGSGPCGYVYTGCVATAQAQAMKHYDHPGNGVDSHCYTSNYGELCADFGATTYDWASMPNGSSNADVAQLMSHCGISVNMQYSPTGSGAYTSNVASSLINYFDYTTNLKYVGRYRFENADWENLMRKECDAGKVMVYKGTGSGGHAFVLDGYDDLGAFHFNWGWGGSANGYFMMDDLTPSGQDYSNSNYAIVGMEPAADFPGLDFSGMTSLSCAATTAIDLSSGTSIVNKYGNTWLSAYGKEKTFEFTTTYPGRITIEIENETDDIAVVLLSHQHQDSVIASGTNGLIADNTVSDTYYLVLDVAKAQDATCDLTVYCPTEDADLIISYAESIPQSIETGQTNVLFRTTLKNIGNNDAGTSTIEYYLSADAVLDGSDLLLGTSAAPALTVGEQQIVESFHTMPTLPAPGSYSLIVVADVNDDVLETVESDTFVGYVNVPDPGVLDCSSAYSITDGVWYWGDTEVDGDSIVDQYWCGWNTTGNEMVFSFTPTASGMANLWFSECIPGSDLTAIVLPTCNENSNCTMNMNVWYQYDTIVNDYFYVIGGVEYFLVVDGQNDVNGEFGVKVDLPQTCPEDTVMYWGSPDLCDSDWGFGLQSLWGYSDYQWFRDGVPIAESTGYSYTANITGDYYVEISENGCTTESQHVQVTFSPAPDTAHIVANTATDVCFGAAAELEVDAGYTYNIQWYLDNNEILGATSITYNAIQSGSYHADIINASCHLTSNTIDVQVSPEIIDFNDQIPASDIGAVYHFPFNENDGDVIGNYNVNGWGLLPVDDRDGNFWFAREFAEATDFIYVINLFTDPDAFTHSIWFKTTETDGAVLIQFNDAPYGGGTPGRTLYMADDGKLHFYLANSGSPVELSSSNAYNDGNWHNVVITADTYASMRINNDAETIADVTPLSLDALTGYWVYGGTEIPAGLSNPPSDAYFQGAFDDIRYYDRELPWMESVYFMDDFNLDAELRFDTVCDMGNVYLDFTNSQPGIIYHVRDMASGDTIFGSPLGTGGSISAGPELINTPGSYDFEVVALDTATGCFQLLSETFHFEVFPTLDPEVSMMISPNDSVCSGTEITVTPQVILGGGALPQFEWILNGVNHGMAADFTLASPADADSLVLIMHPDYTCISSLADTVYEVFTVHPIPNSAFTYPAGACENDSISVTYTGTTTDVASITWDINGITQLQTGDGTHQFAPTSGTTNIGCEVETIYGCSSYFVAPVITYNVPQSDLPDTTWYCDTGTQITLDAGTQADDYLWDNGSNAQTYELFPSEGFVSLTLTNTVGTCELYDSTYLMSYLEHAFIFPESPDTTVCIADGFYYEIPAEFTNVEWSVEGDPYYGNTLNYAYAGNDSLLITLYYTNMYGCNNVSDLILKFEICSGISVETNADFEIYPNPSQGECFIELPNLTEKSIITLHDMTGKKLMIINPTNTIIRMDLTEFADGFYLIKYQSGNQIVTKRLDLIH